MTVHSSENLASALNRKNWSIAKGRVIKAEAVTSGVIHPMVTYAYEVNGRAYVDSTDLQAPGFGSKSKQYEVAQELVRSYSVGQEITVYYDPSNQTNSVLITSPSWRLYGQMALGMVLFIGALFFLILPQSKIGIRQV